MRIGSCLDGLKADRSMLYCIIGGNTTATQHKEVLQKSKFHSDLRRYLSDYYNAEYV
jgi:hypothetical protein